MKRGVWGLVLLLLLSLGLVAMAEEVTVVEYPASNYEPGPGWPDGWTPPPVPSELPADRKAWLEQAVAQSEEITGWEVRVLEPMPAWTKEYPYLWELEEVPCGSMIYAYWFPNIDAKLIHDTWGKDYGGGRVPSGVCKFEPVRFINEAKPRPEELVQADLRIDQFIADMDASNGDLDRDNGAGIDGSPEAIEVFFNMGYASSEFDVPAYLDTRVSRVRVPVRFVSEMMGARVDYDGATGQVRIHFPAISREINRVVPAPGHSYETIFYEGGYYPNSLRFRLEKQTVSLPERTIVLTIDKQEAVVNGQRVPLDAPPVEKQGRTMVPIRFVSEQLGAKVYWVGETPIFPEIDGSMSGTYQVHIFTPFYPLYDYPSPYLERSAEGM